MLMETRRSFITPEDYIKRERNAETKSEYIHGKIYAVSGASRWHNRITVNVVALLYSQLRNGPWEGFAHDMRVRAGSKNVYAYPDVVVACSEARFEDRQLDTLLDPTLLVEVLSDSTEKYDRGRKFAYYQQIESLREYVLISQDTTRIECFTRLEDRRWMLTIAGTLESVMPLESIGCALPLAEVYARIQFEEEMTEETASED